MNVIHFKTWVSGRWNHNIFYHISVTLTSNQLISTNIIIINSILSIKINNFRYIYIKQSIKWLTDTLTHNNNNNNRQTKTTNPQTVTDLFPKAGANTLLESVGCMPHRHQQGNICTSHLPPKTRHLAQLPSEYPHFVILLSRFVNSAYVS